jgi:hypothetical protein
MEPETNREGQFAGPAASDTMLTAWDLLSGEDDAGVSHTFAQAFGVSQAEIEVAEDLPAPTISCCGGFYTLKEGSAEVVVSTLQKREAIRVTICALPWSTWDPTLLPPLPSLTSCTP